MTAYQADIEEGLRRLAKLIDAYGDAYWPLFDRLEFELERTCMRQTRLKAFLQPNSDSNSNVKEQPSE